MLVAAQIACFIAGASLVECRVPGLDFQAHGSLGAPVFSCRPADIDGDGMQDLVFGDHVQFQRRGRFEPEDVAPLPEVAHEGGEPPRFDVWQGGLYLRTRTALAIYGWEGDGWALRERHDIAWPELDYSGQGFRLPAPGGNGYAFEPFVFELDGEAPPELATPTAGGLAIHGMNEAGYAVREDVRLFPPDAPASRPVASALWPPDDRRLRRGWSVELRTLLVENRRLSAVYQRLRVRAKALQGSEVQVWRRPLAARDGDDALRGGDLFAIDEAGPVRTVFPLNGDDLLDFVGAEFYYATDAALPVPYREVFLSTDEGAGFQVFRVAPAGPHAALADFNGDGRLDLYLSENDLFRSGVREMISRMVMSRSMTETLRIHLQDQAGRFSEEPDVTTAYGIRLERPPMQRGPFFERYWSGDDVAHVRGDYNGDRRLDLAVQDRPDRVRVYYATDAAFAGSAALSIEVPALSRTAVGDFDGDGRADLVAVPPEQEGGAHQTRLYLTRGEG